MSKPELKKEKIIVAYEEIPLLEELDFVTLLKDRQRYSKQEQVYKAKKDLTSASMREAIELIKADAVTYVDARGKWTTTLVTGEPGTQTDEQKLKDAMYRIGKLDAAVVAKIFAAAQIPVKPRDPHIRVTGPTLETK